MLRLAFSLLLLITATATYVSQGTGSAVANDNAQEEQINKELEVLLREWEKAFNAKDAARLATLYAERIDVIYEDNVHHRNRKSLQKSFQKQFKEEPNLKTVFSDVERLIVSPTLVIETGIWANTGAVDSSRPTRGRYSVTLQKIQGKWLVVHDRSWAMPQAEGRSHLRTRDPLSEKTRAFLKAFAADDRKFLDNVFADDVEVWINDVKVSGKKAYLARAHHMAHDLFKNIKFEKLHVHTNYFSSKARAFEGKTFGEGREGPTVWTNVWFKFDTSGRTTARKANLRTHVDLRWQDGKIAEMLAFGNPSFMEEEQAAFESEQKGARVTRSDFKKYCEANAGSWTGQVSSVISDTDVGTKGDTSTYYWQAHLVHDGNGMELKGVGPNTTGRSLFYYDSTAKKIRATGVSSAGVVNQETLHRQGANKWFRHTLQTAPDGTTSEFRSVLTFSNKGKTLTIVISKTNADGSATKQTNVWQRIGK